MARSARFPVSAFAAALVAALLIAMSAAGAADGPAQDRRTPMPAPARAAKGETCVEPTADMRRNHMIYLEHERDETVHKGVRGRKHSLKACVECHAVPDKAAAGKPTIEPFCSECHRYAAVRMDCFECHARSPDPRASVVPTKEKP